ncbi:hypothetical protein M3650_10365 [Paenibacillus sp. MER TA 81-3]|uniref:hypothetical protein n=1 Tax=Paenibacillus sp. MER TA 81-3 TaxID=2939573 RepID=UPI00203CE1C4|nr:hypothetical protein [Paenibacillus sp. MER TA 81-3]MCM3339027.1 hypothetical protein [Paenibacillus sp. MER TA 81-3]
MYLIEAPPLPTAGYSSSELLFCGKADVNDDATLSERWLLIYDTDIILCRQQGKVIDRLSINDDGSANCRCDRRRLACR